MEALTETFANGAGAGLDLGLGLGGGGDLLRGDDGDGAGDLMSGAVRPSAGLSAGLSAGTAGRGAARPMNGAHGARGDDARQVRSTLDT